jgi:hypothetical protein
VNGTNYQGVKLVNVTTYLNGPLLFLQARNGKGLIGTKVTGASGCLFVAAGNRPLVQLEGLDNSQAMTRLFSWEGSKGNAYINFGKILDSPSSSYDATNWPNFTSETEPEPRFSTTKFKPERSFSQSVPGDFRDIKSEDAKIELQKYGSDLDKLPKLAAPETKEGEMSEEKE